MQDVTVSSYRAQSTHRGQRLLSGVHFIMMEKLAQAGKGEKGVHAHPLSLHLPSRRCKVAVYAPAEWADKLTLFNLYQYMYCVLQSTYKSTDSPLPPLSNVMYYVRVSLRAVKTFLVQHQREEGSWVKYLWHRPSKQACSVYKRAFL